MTELKCFERFVERHLDKPWKWGKWGLSRNPSITPEFVEKHMDKDWKWGKHGLSENPMTKAIEKEKRDKQLYELNRYITQKKKSSFLLDEKLVYTTIAKFV